MGRNVISKPGALPNIFGRAYPWIVCALGAVFYCYEYYLRITPSVMTQDLMRTFSISAMALGNLHAYYYYAYTPMQLFVGLLLDRYGPRRLLFLACLLCAGGTYMFANTNIHVAEAGRFLIGFGSAFAFVGSLKLATIWLPPQRFGMVAGFILTLGMLGAMYGDVSLTSWVELYGFENTITYTGALGIVLSVILWYVISDGDYHTSRLPSESRRDEFKQAFLGVKKLFSNPVILINGLVGCLMFLHVSILAEMWCPRFLENAHGFTNKEAAWCTSMIFIGWAVGGPLSGLISDVFRRRKLPVVIGALGGAITSGYVILVPNLSHFTIFCLLFLSALFCSSQILVFALARELSPPRFTATAMAFTNLIVMLGGCMQRYVGELLDYSWKANHGTMLSGIPVYTGANFRVALAVVPLGLLIAAILMIWVPETKCNPNKGEHS